jgi:hypothetical protein
MSTEAVLRDLPDQARGAQRRDGAELRKHDRGVLLAAPNCKTVQNCESMIVACFSRHPLINALINALREFPLVQALLPGGAGSSVKRLHESSR